MSFTVEYECHTLHCRSRSRQWALHLSLFTLMMLAFFGAAGLALVLRYLGPGAVGEKDLALNERHLISYAPQFCESIGARAEEKVDKVSATLFLTNHLSHESIHSEDLVPKMCRVFDNGGFCSLNMPILPGYLVFLETNSSESMNDKSNGTLTFSLSCEPRIWLYVVIAVATAALVLLCGCCCIGCCLRLCRKKQKKENNNLFIYTPLLDQTSQEERPDTKEHSLIVGSINKSSCNKKQKSTERTLEIEASNSYRYSTFKPGTKAGGSSVRLSPHVKPASKTNNEECKPRNYSIGDSSYTFDSFRPNK